MLMPTSEQQEIVQMSSDRISFKIQALAGTGKTTTMVQIASALKGLRGRYLAFNRAIVNEAQAKFQRAGGNVKASTMHGLAFGQVGRLYAHRLEGNDAGRLSPIRIMNYYQYKTVGPMRPLTRAGFVKTALFNFLNDDAEHISRNHLPLDHLARLGLTRGWSPADMAATEEILVQDTTTLWRDVLSQSSGLPFPHDAYVRLYIDSTPQVPVDFIMVDEAQDTSRIFLKFLRQQNAQLIVVGDENQSIYTWRGAEDVLQKLDELPTRFLSTSFRFGNPIAGAANEILKELRSSILMKGFETDRSQLCSRALLYRTNAGVFGALMKRGLGKEKKKVYVQGGVMELSLLLDAVEELQHGQSTNHPDFIGYSDWAHVQKAAEAYAAPQEIRLVVKVVEEFPISMLRAALEESKNVRLEDADIVVSTAHKAKGLEFAEVGLGTDFTLPDSNPLIEDEEIPTEESRLNYVAVTRAQKHLFGAKQMIQTYAERNRIASAVEAVVDQSADVRLQTKLKLAGKSLRNEEAASIFIKKLPQDELSAFQRMPKMGGEKELAKELKKEFASIDRIAHGPEM